MKRLIFALSLISSAAQAGTLYQFEINLAGVSVAANDRDHFTKIVARFLADKKLDSACVDLKREYLAKPGTQIIRLLTIADIGDEEFRELQTQLCTGFAQACRFSGSRFSADTAALKFITVDTGNPLEPASKGPRRPIPIASVETFPRFSSSCDSGMTDESFFWSARSHESRNLLARSGIDLKRIMTFGLGFSGTSGFWTFGRPDYWWNGRPTTKDNQPLAPAEILKELH
jgi:hypothetical protein